MKDDKNSSNMVWFTVMFCLFVGMYLFYGCKTVQTKADMVEYKTKRLDRK